MAGQSLDNGSGTVSGRTYRSQRVRGFAEWRPRQASALLVDQVRAVLQEYRIAAAAGAWTQAADR